MRRDAITRLSYHRAAQVAPDGPRISRFLLNPLVPRDTLRNPRARTALHPREHPTVGIYTRYSAAGSTLIAEAPVSASPDPRFIQWIGSKGWLRQTSALRSIASPIKGTTLQRSIPAIGVRGQHREVWGWRPPGGPASRTLQWDHQGTRYLVTQVG